MQELLETLVCMPLVLGCLQPIVADKLVDFFREVLECTFFLSCRLSYFLGRVAISFFYTFFKLSKARNLSGWREVPAEHGSPAL